jgi:hypothetical protein
VSGSNEGGTKDSEHAVRAACLLLAAASVVTVLCGTDGAFSKEGSPCRVPDEFREMTASDSMLTCDRLLQRFVQFFVRDEAPGHIACARQTLQPARSASRRMGRIFILMAATLRLATADWTVTFFDDFNGPVVNASSWNVAVNYSRQGELELYIPANVFVQNGSLVLRTVAEQCVLDGTTFNVTSGWVDMQVRSHIAVATAKRIRKAASDRR